MRRVRDRGTIGQADSLSEKGQNRGKRRKHSNGGLLPGPISPTNTRGSRTAWKSHCWTSAKQVAVRRLRGGWAKKACRRENRKATFTAVCALWTIAPGAERHNRFLPNRSAQSSHSFHKARELAASSSASQSQTLPAEPSNPTTPCS